MNDNNCSFSAMVEIFGHRDMAADHAVAFQWRTKKFSEAVKATLCKCNFPVRNCTMLLDKCLLWHESAQLLIDVLSSLRSHLLLFGDEETTLPLRGLVFAKPTMVEMTPLPTRPNDDLKGLQLDVAAWELFGRVEAFKGIGISIDESVLDSELLSDTERQKILARTFENYYIPDANGQYYRRFLDLRFEPSDLGFQAASNTASLVRETYHCSRKVSRFFVPMLINWVNHMELATPISNGTYETTGKGLDLYLVGTTFNLFRKVAGAELVFSKLVDRLYSSVATPETIDPERRSKLEKFLTKKCIWLQELLQADEMAARIPDEILRRAGRRAFAKALAEQHRIQ